MLCRVFSPFPWLISLVHGVSVKIWINRSTVQNYFTIICLLFVCLIWDSGSLLSCNLVLCCVFSLFPWLISLVHGVSVKKWINCNTAQNYFSVISLLFVCLIWGSGSLLSCNLDLCCVFSLFHQLIRLVHSEHSN